jgi:5-(carboxyamino)imidazole ribonucleotide synthase
LRVGILGGGQLGRMLALAGYPLGHTFRFLEPTQPAPVDGLGEIVRAPYDDPAAVRTFGRDLDVVTYEFENVPDQSARLLAESAPVFPPPAALRMAQDRLAEKQAFDGLGIPTAPYHPVDSRDDLDEGVSRLGLPAVLKTRRFGYDGRGQRVIEGHADVGDAWETLPDAPLLLERFVSFSRELSIVGARSRDGKKVFYPLVENVHEDGILRLTTAPAPVVSDHLQALAQRHASALMDSLDYVGVMALELFQEGDHLLANEVAPRVHNSGHWTQDGAQVSQFENHIRAITGAPLGSTVPRGHSAMFNLIGTVPPSSSVLALENAHLHLYAKDPRPGRKLGHVNVVGEDPGEVRGVLERLESLVRE